MTTNFESIPAIPESPNFRYGRPSEEIPVRMWRKVYSTEKDAKGLPIARQTMHTGRYKLAPACLNDVGFYYCSRDDHALCLSGFKGRMALWMHITRGGENKAPHVLSWLCKVHGPEVMFPGDGEERVVFDGGPIGMSNQAMSEHFMRMTEYRENGGIKQAPMTRRDRERRGL